MSDRYLCGSNPFGLVRLDPEGSVVDGNGALYTNGGNAGAGGFITAGGERWWPTGNRGPRRPMQPQGLGAPCGELYPTPPVTTGGVGSPPAPAVLAGTVPSTGHSCSRCQATSAAAVVVGSAAPAAVALSTTAAASPAVGVKCFPWWWLLVAFGVGVVVAKR